MSDKTKDLIEQASASLVDALKAGKSDALRNYLAFSSRFHRYSFGNQLLIAFQNPNASRVAGFNTWKAQGRYVRKGEKGIAILAPVVGKVKDGEGANVRSEDGKDVSRLYGFRAVHVFDVSQTDGAALPELGHATGPTAGQFIPHIQQAIADAGITLEYSDSIQPARGLSYGGRIVILSGMSDAEQLTVLAHEFAHEILHKKEDRKRMDRTTKETEAEAVAFVVGTACGLDMSTYSADYISLWDGDAELLMESLAQIQQASKQILDAILPSENVPTISNLAQVA